MRHLVSAVVVVSLLLAAGCAAPPATPSTPTATRFQEGEAFFEQGLYADAIASWEKVRDSYYSPELNILTELKIAEAYFLDGKYLEAAAAFEAFLKNHPGHPRENDIIYQLGLAYLKQMLDHDQDQTMTAQALATFETLLDRYPQDPRREEVAAYIERCRNQLAAHELVVGRYYLKSGSYQAAINRFNGVLRAYPAYPDGAEIYYYLGQAYLLDGNRSKADETFRTLFNGYPFSDYVAKAEALLMKHPE